MGVGVIWWSRGYVLDWGHRVVVIGVEVIWWSRGYGVGVFWY